ncbi:hypothetical protein HLB23_26405 [Nocardia uniformis]|uniref:DUF8017 domain-containing protein n=1 Tax=Nocardia uniformis TaxID=53432 RepID=A0A849CAN6_9NOCA|nr:hypothetical protein [Nocardia uniformis]NNH73345.1 hypothetical protein [Nocardia uniformis]
MTSGSDDRNDDATQHNPEWWEGVPEQGSQWQPPQGPPQQPVVPPADPTVVRGGYGPQGIPGTPPGYGPYPTQPPDSDGAYQSGPTPQPPGPNPYQSGPHPYQPGANPYQSGPPGPPYGGPPGPPYGPPPGGNRKGLLFGGIGLLVVVLVAVVVVVLVNRDSDPPPITQPTTSVPATTTGSPTTTRPTTTAPRSQNPTIPGYQVVVPTDVEAAWDIPQDWTIDQTTSEFSAGGETVPVAGLATEGVNYCSGMVRTNMFLSVSQQADPTAAAKDIGEKVARIGWSVGSGVQSGAAEPLTNSDQTLHGVFLETTGTFTAADPACAKSLSVYTFAVAGGSSTLVLTIAADTGVDRAVDPTFAKRLLAPPSA